MWVSWTVDKSIVQRRNVRKTVKIEEDIEVEGFVIKSTIYRLFVRHFTTELTV